jgi:alpha-N-arabinofuranosidase
LNVEARSFAGLTLVEAVTMQDDDLKATNSKAAPDRIAPRPLQGVALDGAHITATLPPASWTVLRFAAG